MRRTWKCLNVSFLLALAVTTFAAQAGQAQNRPWGGGKMDTNLYVGVMAGQANYRNACDGIGGSCEDSDTAWKVLAGYQFHRNFAIEGGYTALGKISASDTIGGVSVSGDIRTSTWELVGVGLLPLTQEFSLYAKLGAARTRARGNATASVGGFTFTQAGTDTSTNATYGLGAQYSFTRNIAARAEWQRYDNVGGDNLGKGDIDVFSAGLFYRF